MARLAIYHGRESWGNPIYRVDIVGAWLGDIFRAENYQQRQYRKWLDKTLGPKMLEPDDIIGFTIADNSGITITNSHEGQIFAFLWSSKFLEPIVVNHET